MKLGIVLGTRDDLPTAAAIAFAARRADHEVAMFAMDAGAHALSGDPETVALMIEADCEITVCSNSAVDVPMPEGVIYGSQDDHAAVLGTSDRVVALT